MVFNDLDLQDSICLLVDDLCVFSYLLRLVREYGDRLDGVSDDIKDYTYDFLFLLNEQYCNQLSRLWLSYED